MFFLNFSFSRSYRFAGYKQFTWWIRNKLGKGVRKVIPSCALWAIRNKYPSETGVYVPFKESIDDESTRRENKYKQSIKY